jgi:hypothetical protein
MAITQSRDAESYAQKLLSTSIVKEEKGMGERRCKVDSKLSV